MIAAGDKFYAVSHEKIISMLDKQFQLKLQDRSDYLIKRKNNEIRYSLYNKYTKIEVIIKIIEIKENLQFIQAGSLDELQIRNVFEATVLRVKEIFNFD